MKSVVQEARQHAERLEQEFAAPVLVIIDVGGEQDSQAVVTVAARAPTSPQASASLVVPLQPRTNRVGTDPKLSFGRSDVCDVVLPFSPVSKHHGYFLRVDGGWQIVDVGSTNGSTLNGKQLVTNQPQLLTDGAIVTLGALTARYLAPSGFTALLKQQLALSN